jgi:8-amino-7-oxononanoate synthase
MSDELKRLVQTALEARGEALYRTRVERAAADGILDFSSNDYLGLRRHPKVIEAMTTAAQRWGAGSGASPLISGYTPAHASAERAIARWKGTESAVLLPSGYQANHAAVQALVGACDAANQPIRFLFDKLIHASLIDAIAGSGKSFRTFAHNDLTRLARLLEEADEGELQIVVTESIFSMDGDAADLSGIVELKRRRPFVLMVDEAHGSGVYGPDGSGLAAELGVADDIDVFIVTLSKAAGCAGGAVCGSRAVAEGLANFGRAYIYSTAIAPAVAAGCEAAIEVMRDEPQRQQRVRELSLRVRAELEAAGWEIRPGDSPIIPIIIGAEEAALALAERLREKGIWVSAVRPPTVPRGSSRLRITLSAEHSHEAVGRLVEELRAAKRA